MPTTVPKGEALLVGLRYLDPDAYDGWDGREGCSGCEDDVDTMRRILFDEGFRVRMLKTRDARAASVLDSLGSYPEIMRKGDIFVFYYSGHGGQAWDYGGDEEDNYDETLYLYDRRIIDDQLARIWHRFRPGVRIVMISDSCHSETSSRNVTKTRFDVPLDLKMSARRGQRRSEDDMKTTLLHLAGCRDEGESEGLSYGGAFTVALRNVWDDGDFSGSYRDLSDAIRTRLDRRDFQENQINEYGPPSGSFIGERPFLIRSGADTGDNTPQEEPEDDRPRLTVDEAVALLLDRYGSRSKSDQKVEKKLMRTLQSLEKAAKRIEKAAGVIAKAGD